MRKNTSPLFSKMEEGKADGAVKSSASSQRPIRIMILRDDGQHIVEVVDNAEQADECCRFHSGVSWRELT